MQDLEMHVIMSLIHWGISCKLHFFFLNFKYSRGDPHCKDFIILKKQQKEYHHCTKRSQEATTKRTAQALQAETRPTKLS